MQAENSKDLSPSKQLGVLPFDVSPSDLEYWDMKGDNIYDDVICETFAISQESTTLLLGDCNNSLRTEPVDIFLSAITHSFSRVFADRGNPAIYNESHGRESWDPSIDISRTVGWFTTIFPIQVEVNTVEDDVLDTVRQIKDRRHQVPDNGVSTSLILKP